jgi:hypothetical protein
MNLTARAPLLFVGVVLLAASVVGCSQLSAEKQIRERIASIREAIMAERPEGIIEFGTPDWRFDTPDGQRFDRASYLERTRKLFAEIDIESLDTRIDRIDRHDARTEVTLTQTLVRVETDAAGVRTRWKMKYGERQEWIWTRDRGWLVAHVGILYRPIREALPNP